ncbi:unnamed protein product [Nezara viridula]|nr:unnamed protein product [Nezara viridula]
MTATIVDGAQETTARPNNDDFINADRIEEMCKKSFEPEQQQLNLLVKQLTALCAKKLSGASTSVQNQKPPSSTHVEKNYALYCQRCGSLKVTKIPGGSVTYVVASEKYISSEVNEELADRLFLSSLLPHVRNIPDCHKLDWQIKCMRLFKRYLRRRNNI